MESGAMKTALKCRSAGDERGGGHMGRCNAAPTESQVGRHTGGSSRLGEKKPGRLTLREDVLWPGNR